MRTLFFFVDFMLPFNVVDSFSAVLLHFSSSAICSVRLHGLQPFSDKILDGLHFTIFMQDLWVYAYFFPNIQCSVACRFSSKKKRTRLLAISDVMPALLGACLCIALSPALCCLISTTLPTSVYFYITQLIRPSYA